MSKTKAKVLNYNEFYDLLRIRTKDRTITLDGDVAAEILAEAIEGKQHDAYAEIADLKRQLAKAKAMQYKLFKMVPADKLVELTRENPEQMQ